MSESTRREVSAARFFHLQPLGAIAGWRGSDPSRHLFEVDHDNECADGPSIVCATGCTVGPVWVTVTGRDGMELTLLDATAQAWDEGDEQTVLVTSPLVVATEFDYDLFGPVFIPTRPGLHRLRVLARGRWAHWGETVDEPQEEFQIELWPVDGEREYERVERVAPPAEKCLH